MAGILANSLSQTMVGAGAPDASQAGYITGEQIVLTTNPAAAGATYAWVLAKPSGGTISSALSDATLAAPVFTPDVAGFWVVTVLYNGTTAYVLRLSVTATAAITVAEAIRVPPKAEAAIAVPPVGEVVFFSASALRWRVKDSLGVVRDWAGPGTVTYGATLIDADVLIDISGKSSRRLLTATLGANRTCTIATTGAVSGDRIRITRADVSAWTYAIINGGPAAGTMQTMPGSEKWFGDFDFDGTNWFRSAEGQLS